MPSDSRLLAMLIDGDNAQPTLLDKVLAEAAKYGQVTVRRIYGDWTRPNLNGWKKVLNSHAVVPVQQFAYTTGKNATDSAMIIDAMDILHGQTVGGFCIVSSDSDYTRLATRVREQGLFVMGVGENKTPEAFVSACEVFVYTENLTAEPKAKQQEAKGASLEWLALVSQAVEMSANEEGWANLAAVGSNLLKLSPAFDSRTYGHKQLSSLIKSQPNTFEATTKGGSVSTRLKAQQSTE